MRVMTNSFEQYMVLLCHTDFFYDYTLIPSRIKTQSKLSTNPFVCLIFSADIPENVSY